jgi:hypothetical protein
MPFRAVCSTAFFCSNNCLWNRHCRQFLKRSNTPKGAVPDTCAAALRPLPPPHHFQTTQKHTQAAKKTSAAHGPPAATAGQIHANSAGGAFPSNHSSSSRGVSCAGTMSPKGSRTPVLLSEGGAAAAQQEAAGRATCEPRWVVAEATLVLHASSLWLCGFICALNVVCPSGFSLPHQHTLL